MFLAVQSSICSRLLPLDDDAADLALRASLNVWTGLACHTVQVISPCTDIIQSIDLQLYRTLAPVVDARLGEVVCIYGALEGLCSGRRSDSV